MNGLTEPPADDATEYRWMVPTEPAFDAIMGIPHEFALPPDDVRPNHYVGVCGDSFILNEDSRPATAADSERRCPRCVMNRRRSA